MTFRKFCWGAFLFLLAFTFTCQKQVEEYPPESIFVQENGSVPIGLPATLATAGLDNDCISCNSQNRYGRNLKRDSKVSASILLEKLTPYVKKLSTAQENELQEILQDHIMWWMVRAVLIEGDNNNFGALSLRGKFWTDDNGHKHPVIAFRTGFTPNPLAENSCYRALLKQGHVKHVINLYDGDMYMDDLIEAEKKVAAEHGATYVRTSECQYGKWRDTIRKHPEQGPERESAAQAVAKLIKEQILLPGGEPPRGNILVHCGGGMHRTGMIMGILQKVVNGASMDEIETTYKYHVGYKDEDHSGGFEQGNLDFIGEFKQELLQ